MVRVLSYLTLKELLIVGGVNRRLYIVSGDIDLLRLHSRPRLQVGVLENEESPSLQLSSNRLAYVHMNPNELTGYVYNYQLACGRSPVHANEGIEKGSSPKAPPSGLGM